MKINILVGNSLTTGSAENVFAALCKAAQKVNGKVHFVLHNKILVATKDSTPKDIEEQYGIIANPVHQEDYDCRVRIFGIAQEALSNFHSSVGSIAKQSNGKGTDDVEYSFLHSGKKVSWAITAIEFAEIALNAKIHPVSI